jgi:hypothetical protein
VTLDVTQFPSYGQALIATTSSAMPNVIWQNTSSGATYASASSVLPVKTTRHSL